MTQPLDTPPEPTGIRILVAEDNQAVREFIVRSLQGVGHSVTEAEDGGRALDRLGQKAFDVLVTDIVMPQMDGIALALKAVRVYPDLRVVMISGYAQERMRAHNLDALVHRIIAKPFSMEELCDAVRDALALPPGGH